MTVAVVLVIVMGKLVIRVGMGMTALGNGSNGNSSNVYCQVSFLFFFLRVT